MDGVGTGPPGMVRPAQAARHAKSATALDGTVPFESKAEVP